MPYFGHAWEMVKNFGYCIEGDMVSLAASIKPYGATHDPKQRGADYSEGLKVVKNFGYCIEGDMISP